MKETIIKKGVKTDKLMYCDHVLISPNWFESLLGVPSRIELRNMRLNLDKIKKLSGNNY